MKRILIIKLGALGDFIQATAAFADIRAHHPDAHITLMTTRGLLNLAADSPWIDSIMVDEKPKLWQLTALRRLRHKLQGFDLIYDLQTSQRTRWYFELAGRPAWCGHAPGCLYRQTRADRNHLHTLERIADQLKQAGVPSTHTPDISYARHDATDLLQTHKLRDGKFVVLVPGGSAHRPEKRWPLFPTLITQLHTQGLQTVLVGGRDEKDLLAQIATQTGAINLGGQTSLNQLVDIFMRAKAAIGNDTGPMHIATASGCPGVVLFGAGSNPTLCAPQAPHMHILHQPRIADISVEDVLAALGFIKG